MLGLLKPLLKMSGLLNPLLKTWGMVAGEEEGETRISRSSLGLGVWLQGRVLTEPAHSLGPGPSETEARGPWEVSSKPA